MEGLVAIYAAEPDGICRDKKDFRRWHTGYEGA
jgi:hypothetical protein